MAYYLRVNVSTNTRAARMSRNTKHIAMAKRLERFTIRYDKKWKKEFPVSIHSLENRSMHAKISVEVVQMRHVIADILSDRLASAWTIVSNFDTNLREEFPVTVYTYLEKHCGN